ncbi:MAG: hypothetical protein NTW04_04825, partial [Elusimicrobia bacterium]|nr:hypothetical protein [Elusimicrobiota bacterium]
PIKLMAIRAKSRRNPNIALIIGNYLKVSMPACLKRGPGIILFFEENNYSICFGNFHHKTAGYLFDF